MTYRVGADPRHLHRGNDCIGVCFDPADTALIVDVMEGCAPDAHQLAELRALLAAYVDDETCHYDHHGTCQAHLAEHEGRCANAAAKELLSGDPHPWPIRPHTPDVDHTNGAREALDDVRLQLAAWSDSSLLTVRDVRQILDSAAAELGVNEEAPSGPSSLPESDLPGSVVGEGANGSSEGAESAYLDQRCPRASGGWLNCGPDCPHHGEPERKPDDPPHPTCVETTRRGSPRREWVCGRDCDYREPERKADQSVDCQCLFCRALRDGHYRKADQA